MNRPYMTWKSQAPLKLLIGAMMLGALSLSACSDDNPDPDGTGIITGDDTGTSDTGASDADDTGNAGDGSGPDAEDAGDTGSPPDAVTDADSGDSGDAGDTTPDVDPLPACPQTPCADDKVCVDGQCVDDTPANKCAAATDLGTLTTSQPLTAAGSFENATDVLTTTCSPTPGAEQVLTFTVAEDSRVSFEVNWTGSIDGKVEFRTNCAEQATGGACFDSNSAIFFPAGTQVWMVVEQDVGQGFGFEVELTATAESCPLGQSICNAGELEICAGGSQGQTFACASTCADLDTCAGDTCGSAIDVTASTTFSGELTAYENSINFDGETLCSNGQGDTIATPGREIVFRLPNLTAGQTVHIDAKTNDSNLNAIFVLTSCTSQPYACSGVFDTTERVDFVAPQDGTYYVVIDKRTTSASTFTYSFEYR